MKQALRDINVTQKLGFTDFTAQNANGTTFGEALLADVAAYKRTEDYVTLKQHVNIDNNNFDTGFSLKNALATATGGSVEERFKRAVPPQFHDNPAFFIRFMDGIKGHSENIDQYLQDVKQQELAQQQAIDAAATQPGMPENIQALTQYLKDNFDPTLDVTSTWTAQADKALGQAAGIYDSSKYQRSAEGEYRPVPGLLEADREKVQAYLDAYIPVKGYLDAQALAAQQTSSMALTEDEKKKDAAVAAEVAASQPAADDGPLSAKNLQFLVMALGILEKVAPGLAGSFLGFIDQLLTQFLGAGITSFVPPDMLEGIGIDTSGFAAPADRPDVPPIHANSSAEDIKVAAAAAYETAFQGLDQTKIRAAIGARAMGPVVENMSTFFGEFEGMENFDAAIRVAYKHSQRTLSQGDVKQAADEFGEALARELKSPTREFQKRADPAAKQVVDAPPETPTDQRPNPLEVAVPLP